jgi:hypothetical protein
MRREDLGLCGRQGGKLRLKDLGNVLVVLLTSRA